MSHLRFLLDEHIAHAVRDQLLRLDSTIDILVVGQSPAPSLGSPDPELLEWLEKTGYVLVTNNRRTMPEHIREHFAANRHLPGVCLLKRNARMGRVIEDLYLLWAAYDAGQFADKILYLPLQE
jgi:hypothetical protein